MRGAGHARRHGRRRRPGLYPAAFEECQKRNSDVIEKLNFTEAPSTEAVSQIRAQQAANQVNVDLVLSGSDAVGAGIVEDVWEPLVPQFENELSQTASYSPEAKDALDVVGGQAAVLATEPTGPLLLFNPETVSDPPTSADELLEWAEANPKRFTYARPELSGPGRDFLMGLPYILEDADPSDPEKGWDKTWSYLAELDQYVAPYPSSTGESVEGVAQGSYDIVALTAGWDILSRTDGVVPLDFEIGTFDGFTWIAAGHYAAVPKGSEEGHLGAALALVNCVLEDEIQLSMYETYGAAVPGPAIDGITVSDAPQAVQEEVAKFSRPIYDKLFESVPTAPELEASKLAYAFDRWQREIGS
ncbi:MAG: extracellular solute-binding protein [Nocardioidaceae bacterium]